MHTITKTTLLAQLASKKRRPRAYYAEALADLLEAISVQVASGNAVRLTGFGTLRPQHKRERAQRHIRTGETITVPAHTTIHFRPGEILKARLNGQKTKRRN